MSKTILISKDKSLNDLLEMNLRVYLGTELLIVKDFTACKNLINIIGSVDLIISSLEKNLELDKANEFLKMADDFFSSKGLQDKFVVLGLNAIPSYPHITFFKEPFDLPPLVKSAAKILNVTAKEMAVKDVGEFYDLGIDFLRSVNSAVCNIYIKSSNHHNETTFEKFIAKDELIESSKVDELFKKGHKQFYIPADQRLKFINSCTKIMIDLLTHGKLSHQERISIGDKSRKLAQDEALKFGLTENVIKLSDACINSLKKTIKEHSKLHLLLKNLMNTRVSFAFAHCQLNLYVAFYLIKMMEWGTEEQQDKINFVTYFHDIVLIDDNLVKIHSNEELKKLTLSADEISLVEKHALLAAELVESYPLAPIGADQIIKQHHGSKNGIGFTEMLGNNISPLAQVFIIAEEYTKLYFDLHFQNKSFNQDLVINKLSEKYNKVKQKKLVEILKNISL